MRFLPFLKRSDESRRSRRRVAPPPDLASVEQLRTRTRRRLIGAAVLVTGAVVLLPMALESNPRPPSTPVTIDMPARPGAAGPAADALAPRTALLRPGEAPAAAPGSAPASGSATGSIAAASAAPSVSRSEAAAVAKPAPVTAPAAVPRPAARVDAAPPRKLAAPPPAPVPGPVARPPAERRVAEADKADKAKAAVGRSDKPTATKPAADKPAHSDTKAHAERKEPRTDAKAAAAKKPGEARVFVQVGAYAEASTVKSVRQRVDKLGMKSHEQAVETASGQRTRVRLGPFASREEADRAAAKLRAGGLGATVVTP